MYRRAPLPFPAVLAAVVLTLSGCASGNRAPVTGPLPAPAPERMDEPASLVERPAQPARRDLLGGVDYDLPVEQNSWVEDELDFLVRDRREVIARWLARGDYYEDFVKSTLRAHGDPTDLYDLAMIESGYLPTARSSAGAVGLWQFMAGTARGYGLRIDSLVDERMDPVRSTRAAARHLHGLKEEMGSWALAAAAYNAGSGRISRSLQSFGVDNFWDLAQQGDLATETKKYVPRLYAMTIIERRRDHFGFPPAPDEESFAFDSIQVEYSVPLSELAKMGPASLEELTQLNPHLRRGVVPSGGYWVWVPAGEGVAMQRGWLASDFRREQGYGSYAVRGGDTLGELAELSGLAMSRIRELNLGVDWDHLPIGKKLKLPYTKAQQLADRPMEKELAKTEKAERPEKPDGVKKPADPAEPETHEVAKGETLWSIAHRYGVSVAALQEENGLDTTTIVIGQALRIPAGGEAASSR